MTPKYNHNQSKFTMLNQFGQSSTDKFYVTYRTALLDKTKELELLINLGPELNAKDAKLISQLLNKMRNCISND